MKNLRPFVLLILLVGLSCGQAQNTETAMPFDSSKWKSQEGKDYPYRNSMLSAILANDSIRNLNKAEILDLLGAPSYYRENKNFLYYQIQQKRLGLWPLHTKTLVIKFANQQNIEWIKIHE